MITAENNRVIEIFGVSFSGVNELKQLVRQGGFKDGVYLGVDDKTYPCFDFEDFMNENRCFSNFVFAQSKEELERKLNILKTIKERANYRKYTEELAPMIYWEGDSHHPMEITECEAVYIP